MFMAQVVATTFSCFIQVAVLNFALTNIKDACTLHQPEHFTCPGGKVFFSASIIWGLIGPQRIFSPGQIYSGLFWFFLVGARTPVIFYFAARKWPKSPIKYLIAPLLFGRAGSTPPPQQHHPTFSLGVLSDFFFKKSSENPTSPGGQD